MEILTKSNVIEDIKQVIRRKPSKPWDSPSTQIYRHKCGIIIEGCCGMNSDFVRVTLYPQSEMWNDDKKIDSKEFRFSQDVVENTFDYIKDHLYLVSEK